MTSTTDYIEKEFQIPWSMTKAEKEILIRLLETIKPKISLEIGTFNGGSLQVMSHFSDKVYAIDLNANYRDTRCDKFSNVDYLIGDSKRIVPELVSKINSTLENIDFILIDGDHTSQGVLADIANVLKLVPKKSITVLLHDSFNPECRKGIKLYNYDANSFVHNVELDFAKGVFNLKGLYRQMWGGFALIEMLPEKRKSELKINSNHNKIYKKTYFMSIHFFKNTFWFLKPIYKVFKK